MLRRGATLIKGIPTKCPRAGGPTTGQPKRKPLESTQVQRCQSWESSGEEGTSLEEEPSLGDLVVKEKERILKNIKKLEDTTEQHTCPHGKKKRAIRFLKIHTRGNP